MVLDGKRPRLELAALRSAYETQALTPEALVESLYAEMERQPVRNGWITRVPKAEALASARALGPLRLGDSRALYGVPFAVKDNIDVAGLATTAACPAFSYLPQRSAPTVQALLDAGALCLGKANMDQFATGLVGTRSPYGRCENVFDSAYLSGGSSSGSALLVAAHQVSFSLGTDTAGSGRVPAALNNIVGLKPSLGLLPRAGVVPACASLDCVSIFATCVADAVLVRELMQGRAQPLAPRLARFRYGIPNVLTWFGDDQSAASFQAALAQLDALGGERVELDFAPFSALGDLLYGPFVVERQLAVGAFIAAHESEVLPVTRDIILGARRFDASDAFRAFQQLGALREACMRELDTVDLMVTPTVPAHYRIAEELAEPRAINDRLGVYTRFVNFVGCAALAVPSGFRRDGLPFGISLVSAPGRDRVLDGLGDALHRASGAGMGGARHAFAFTPSDQLDQRGGRPAPLEVRLAVVGAHMRGMALHGELAALSARYVATVRTAPEYRLYALPGGPPERPGLVNSKPDGVAIEVELWDLSFRSLGELMAKVPPPLTIGTLRTGDGELVKGFLCESYATVDARDISRYGGYRAYVAERSS
jgi:allophanate hydrolase